MMLNVPMYALLSKITFFNIKKYNYTEHLVVFMFITAQLSIIGVILMLFSAVLGTSIMVISTIVLPIYIIYSAYCLKRLYKLDVGEIILKTFFLIFVLTILTIIITIVFFGGFYLINPEGLKEFFMGFAPKK
ncbi:MAG: hypothetical protein COA67_06370 [Lutibacter sp.]|nr:MAG: hypothetical protein COA67_06370 [Lutibacter sp.]